MWFLCIVKYGVCTYMQSHIWVVTKNQMKVGINGEKYGYSSFQHYGEDGGGEEGGNKRQTRLQNFE